MALWRPIFPFDLAPDGSHATFHLMRSNPIARTALNQTAILAVTGPDAYVSPDWYGTPDQVPTWNYTAVHLRGTITQLPDAALHGVLDVLSARFEAQLAPKTPWTSTKMSPGVMDRMMRQIMPFRFDVTSIDSTFKLNQNKTEMQRLGAAKGIEASPVGLGNHTLAALMRGV